MAGSLNTATPMLHPFSTPRTAASARNRPAHCEPLSWEARSETDKPARKTIQRGLRLSSSRRHYWMMVCLMLLCFAEAARGVNRRNGSNEFVGIWCASIGFALMLGNLVIRMNARSLRRVLGQISRMKDQ